MQHKDTWSFQNELFDGKCRNQFPTTGHQEVCQESTLLNPMEKGTLLCTAAANSDLETKRELLRSRTDAYSQTALHAAVQKSHYGITKLEQGANMHKPDADGLTPIAMAQKHGASDMCELLSSYECKRKFVGHDQILTANSNRNNHNQSNSTRSTQFRHPKHIETMTTTCLETESPTAKSNAKECTNKRVTIHIHSERSERSTENFGKLICLPDSIEDLLRIAGKHCLI